MKISSECRVKTISQLEDIISESRENMNGGGEELKEIYRQDIQALEIAVRALRYTQPIECRTVGVFADREYPSCGSWIKHRSEKPAFCPDCGQALLWHEEELAADGD